MERDSPLFQRPHRPRRTLSWLGLAAILGGLTLIWLYFDNPHLTKNPSPVFGMTYLGTGCILILWGLRALAGEIAGIFGKWRNRPARQYRVSMPREAFIYGLILLVLCAGALLGRSNMLMLVFGLMAGPFILNGQVTLGILRRLHVERSLPEHATVGENFSVKLSLTNRKHLLSSWMVSAEDMVQAPHEQLQPAVLFACVPSQSTRQAVYEIRPAHRGLYEFGPVRVMSRFPLGLMERSIDLGLVERFVVYPRIGRLKPNWRRAVAAGELASDLARIGHSASDDEFHRLREYRRGDNPRAIHWRTTARRNELMVKEFQHGRSQDLLLAVDLWLPATRAGGTRASGAAGSGRRVERRARPISNASRWRSVSRHRYASITCNRRPIRRSSWSSAAAKRSLPGPPPGWLRWAACWNYWRSRKRDRPQVWPERFVKPRRARRASCAAC